MLKSISGILLAAAFLLSCTSEASESQIRKAAVVRLAKVEHKEIALPIRNSGKLAAKKEVRLSFKTGGIIHSFYADEGDLVKKGQKLAMLDMDEVNAYLKQAESAYVKAKRDQQRVLNLYADSAASLEQKQNVETALNVAEANLNIARFNARYSEITAPFNGRILKRYMNSGEITNAGAPVLAIAADQNNWVVRVEVSDRDILRIQLNDSAQVTVDAYPGKTFTAFVSEKAAGASPISGMFEIELTFDDINMDLLSGFIASAVIYPKDKQKLALIPVKAINTASAKTGFVFTIDKNSGKAVRKEINITHIFDDSIAVAGSLNGENFVIGEGMEYLADGQEVFVQNPM
ncbi:MAG: efflux RND transporter periplasmic adaptor subunit [Calditrichaeota bacterium]|nr:efflux RND transporter periplasmic adaptor subunit [Calditrichota bacterium]